MTEPEQEKSPSQELAEQAADALLKAKLVRKKDLAELRSALGIGSATAEDWISWLDLAMEKPEDDGNE